MFYKNSNWLFKFYSKHTLMKLNRKGNPLLGMGRHMNCMSEVLGAHCWLQTRNKHVLFIAPQIKNWNS